MDLRDYPRPKDDTGIGVHWNAGFAAAIGLGQIEQIWLPRLRDMGVKWVKISQHDGALDFARLLLKNDIMPIVRIYRPQPNPGTLGPRELQAVSDYVSAGVRYIEFNNEPDLGVEWQGGEVPLDGAQISARDAIVDMEAVLQRGGYPAIPALRPGGRWDLVGEICRLGRRDLLSQPVWQAVHNYSANHPLDYPYDRVNQEGAPCPEELFLKLSVEKWNGDAWEGWTLEQLNLFRRTHTNPGATAVGDPTGWRSYERYDHLIRNQIGRSLPILATENGFVVGERQDKRYPATSPQLHALQTLEACRIMMGTSALYDHAPDYYFCTAYWLVGNFVLGSWAPAWETAAWFSQNWQNGQLPIVAALSAEPKRVRTWSGDAGLPGRLFGAIRNGPDLPLTMKLVRADGWLAIIQTDADGRYEFTDLPFDRFTLSIIEARVSQEVVLTHENPAGNANFDLTGVTIRLASSVVRGNVQGGAGKIVRLTRQASNPWEEQQLVAADRAYRFIELEPGAYTLKLLDTSVVKADLVLDGRNELVIDLAVPGWGWELSDGGVSPGFGIVRCRVVDRVDLPVHLWTPGWSGMILRTGSKQEYGRDACEFAPLGAGTYKVQPEGVTVIADVPVDGSRVIWVTFKESAGPVITPAQESVISGCVRSAAGAVGHAFQLRLTGPEGERTVVTSADGAYRFADLPAGAYRVSIDGMQVARDGIVLDGRNADTVDLEVPGAADGAIFGTVANGGGRLIRLLLPPVTSTLIKMRADAAGRYRFDKLFAGAYTVQVMASDPATRMELERTAIAVDGTAAVQVDFALVSATAMEKWTAKVEDGGTGPGSSVVRCQVQGEQGREVRLWAQGWAGITQRAGSKPEYGADACEFAPLGPGRYFIEPVGLEASPGQPLRAEINLSANRVGWVRFAKTAAPVLPVESPAPVEPPRRSVIAGRIMGGAGRTIKLTGLGITRTVVVATDETYNLGELAAGTYTLTVLDSVPPTGSTQTQADIRVDGVNAIRIDLELVVVGPTKTIEHYLLVGGHARTKDDFVIALQYVCRFQPVVGTDEAEARKARHVTILGDTSAISASVEQGLRMIGCQVQLIEGDYAATLGKLLAENRPY
jgi:hypothetical protein